MTCPLPDDNAPDLLDRILEPDFDAGTITLERAAALTGFSLRDIHDFAYGDQPLVKVTTVDDHDEIDLADLVAVVVAATGYSHDYAPPPDEEVPG